MTLDREFSYTADKRNYLPMLVLFIALAVIEATMLTLLFRIFVDAPWEGMAVTAFLILFAAFPAILLPSPLFSRHRVDRDGLLLRYGFRSFRIPHEAIASLQPTRYMLHGFEPFACNWDEEEGQLKVCFSESGQLLLKLKTPLTFGLGLGRKATTDTLLFNADNWPELLAALDVKPEGSRPDTDEREEPTSVQDRREERSQPASTADLADPREPVRALEGIEGSPCPDGEAEAVLALRDLTRRFGDFTAVDNLTLTVRAGEIYGLLGCNGAGKTTTIKMMTGLLEPQAGTVHLAGIDLWAEPLEGKATFGYVPDQAAFYGRLSGREHLQFLAQMRGLPWDSSEQRIDDLLTRLDLAEQQHRSCQKYSFGMKRKLSLAGALLHEPRVLILDEPFNGLDPRAAQQLKRMLGAWRREGAAILLSTHDLATAESFCDRVGILHKGHLIAEEAVTSLAESHGNLERLFFSLTESDREVTS